MLSGLDLARARRLEQAQAVARDLLGILVALPLVVDFQAGPFIRVHRTNVGPLEVAVGRRLWREQRRVGSVDSQFSISTWFSVLMGTRGSADMSRLGLMLNRIEFTWRRIARAACDCHRTDNDRDGQKSWDE
jgi:hypothetical protein